MSAGRLQALKAQPVPVHPVLPRKELLQGDEGLPQQGVLPEGPVPKHPQVNHPLVQVPVGDAFIHQLGGNRGTRQSARPEAQTVSTDSTHYDGTVSTNITIEPICRLHTYNV